MPDSHTASPVLLILTLVRSRFVTVFPLMPCWTVVPLMVMLLRLTLTADERWMAPFSSVFSLPPTTPSEAAPLLVLALVKFIQFRLMPRALMKLAPRAEMFWMVPPVPALPLPVTVRPPVTPVLFRMMPVVAPLQEILRKVSPLAPIVELATLSAVAVGAVVLPMVLVPVTLTAAAPPVAVKTAAVPLRVMPPLKLSVVPALLLRLIP